LARRLRDHWNSHNRDIYELLDFADVESLEMICHNYKLDATFKEKEALKGKIEKANLLVFDKKPAVGVEKVIILLCQK
jgi:phage terminase small subunit